MRASRMLVRAALVAGVVAALAAVAPRASAAFTVFEAAGATPADITAARDAFRAAVGGGTVAGPGGSFGGVRREINWDGVPDLRSDSNPFPGNFFNNRGAEFTTPGTGFLVSADASSDPAGVPVLFGFPNDFQVFSPQRLFTAVNSNITDVTFFLPGTSTPAVTTAFGVIFTDVETGGGTKVEFFAPDGTLIFTRDAIAFGNQSLAFVGGVANAGELIGRVRITSGINTIVSNGVLGNQVDDVVVMDDFLYAEPFVVPQAVPAPASVVLLGIGAAGGLAARLRRRGSR